MKRTIYFAAPALFALSLFGQTQVSATKVGTINIQGAMISTQEGKKAVGELQAKFEPTSKKLEGMRDEINALQAELSKGSNTMGDERRRELARDIDQKTRELNRATEDAQAEFQQEQDRILQVLGQKMMAVINKYSNDHAYTLILDISSPQTPVVFAANGIDVTSDIIKMYDEEAVKAAAASAAAPAAPAQAAPVKPAK
ncbi:MAG: OmpH family outer membrane protein [Bryobacteraceae bacterium]|nr:OmpH family outer membrane protein [Bryobacteraceae bacterium]